MLFPDEEHGVLFDAIEGIPLREYAFALAKLTDSTNLKYISKISKWRIAIWITSKKLTDELVESGQKIKINDHELEIKPFVQKNKRLVLSNVYPMITNDAITQALSTVGIQPITGITNIRAGINEIGFSHMLSFRRQTYIKPGDESKIPEALQVAHNGSTHWIYLTTDTTTCFICKEKGHIARVCPDNNIGRNEGNTENNQDNIEPIRNNKENSPHQNKQTQKTIPPFPNLPSKEPNRSENETAQTSTDDTRITTLPITLKKRPLSSTASSSSSSYQDQSADTNAPKKTDNKQLKHINKKLKNPTEEPENSQKTKKSEVEHQLEPAKDHLSSSENKYVLSFEKFTEFLTVAFSNPNINETALEYTNDIGALYNMLSDAYVFIKERHLKSRITRIKKRLRLCPKFNLEANDETSSTDESSKLTS